MLVTEGQHLLFVISRPFSVSVKENDHSPKIDETAATVIDLIGKPLRDHGW